MKIKLHLRVQGLGVLGIFLAVIGSLQCSTSPPTDLPITTGEDFQRIETLLNLDRSISAVVDAARERAVHPELRTFADEVGHRFFQRTEAIAAWKRQSSAPSRITSLSLPCISSATLVPGSAGIAFDIDVAKQLLRHRQCAIAFAQEVEHTTRDAGLRSIADDFIGNFTAEAKQLDEWVHQWNTEK